MKTQKSALWASLSFMAIAVIFLACQKNLSNKQQAVSQSSSSNIEIPALCGFPQESTLWGGQTINTGTVTVVNDADDLAPGQFPYQQTFATEEITCDNISSLPQTYTIMIPKSDLACIDPA